MCQREMAYVFVPGSPKDANLLPYIMGLKLPRRVISYPLDDRPFRAPDFGFVGPYWGAIDGGVKAVAVGYLRDL